MNNYTKSTIEALKHMHSVKSGSHEFVRGGKKADDILARSIAYLEEHELFDGAWGGPANAALAIAGKMSDQG